MKGHLTRITLAAALTAAAATPAAAFDLFGLFGNDENSLETMLESVPADTPIFAAGHADSRMADFTDSMMMPSSESEIRELRNLFESEDIDSPSLSLLFWFADDYFTQANLGYQAIMDRYGIKEDGAGLFYLDGAMPVARIALDDEEAFRAVLNQASTDTGLEARTTTVNEIPVQLWRLTPPEAKLSADLAIAVNNGLATVTVFNGQDTPSTMAQRLGLSDIDQSMADAGTWEDLGERYDFDDSTRMFLDFARLVESFMLPDNTALGRDLTRLAPEMMAETSGSLDDSCRAEVVDLARQAPRLVAGNEALSITGDTLSQSIRLIWEINNAPVTTELQKLPGSLPTYATEGTDKIFALALGMDVNQLAPVATALWTQFTAADFECQALVDLQAQAKTTNPAMIGMATGMAQGVKGIGAALYSLEADPSSPVGLTGSALVSLSAENPETIAGLIASSIPGLAGLSIPSNGEAVEVPAPLPTPPIYAAIKGKHLVVYTGEPAQADAEAMADEPLNTRGTTAGAFNYQGFGNAALTVLQAIPNAADMSDVAGDGSCSELYAGILQLAQMPMVITYEDDYTDRGWEALINADVQATDSQAVNVEAGNYQIETLDSTCSWTISGQVTFENDGTGTFSQADSTGQCDVYRSDYAWTQDGASLTLEIEQEQGRDNCDGDWAEVEADSEECTVLGESEDGFYCQYYIDGEANLMRYTRDAS